DFIHFVGEEVIGSDLLDPKCFKQYDGIMLYACPSSRLGIRAPCLPFPAFSACLAVCQCSLAWRHPVPRKANRKQCFARDGIEHTAPLSELSSSLKPCRLEWSSCRFHSPPYAASHLCPQRAACAGAR